METVCILVGGPDRVIVDRLNKKWLFEDHPYCGPVVIGKNGDPLANQPPESSPFWEAVQCWYDQGKRTRPPLLKETWCIWDKPTMQKMRHLGGVHYMLVTDESSNVAIEPPYSVGSNCVLGGCTRSKKE